MPTKVQGHNEIGQCNTQQEGGAMDRMPQIGFQQGPITRKPFVNCYEFTFFTLGPLIATPAAMQTQRYETQVAFQFGAGGPRASQTQDGANVLNTPKVHTMCPINPVATIYNAPL